MDGGGFTRLRRRPSRAETIKSIRTREVRRRGMHTKSALAVVPRHQVDGSVVQALRHGWRLRGGAVSGAAAWPVTAGAVGMGGLEPGQDPGPVQEIVDQGIDRDQLHANFQPARANVSGADQNARHRHCQHLVRNAVDVAHRLDQANARLRHGSERRLFAWSRR